MLVILWDGLSGNDGSHHDVRPTILGSIESSCAWSSIWFSCYRDGVGASRHVRVCVDVEFDRRGRQETSSSEWWWAVKWHKSVGARYGYRGVRLGEARNPGPPKRLRRILASFSQSMNRFEILSSDDELVVPTTVPASSGAVREVVEGSAVQPRRLVIVSQDLPPFLRAASTEELPGTTVLEASTEAHQIGTPRDNFSEETVSVGRASEEDIGEVVEDDDLDDGRSDVGSMASEDEEAETPRNPIQKCVKWQLHLQCGQPSRGWIKSIWSKYSTLERR